MNLHREMGFYEKYIKRLIDIGCSLCAIFCFSWLFALIGIAVKIKLGSPIIFKQPRPGIIDADTGTEKIFMMYKFRTMTDERDADGNLLPDEVRLTSFGAWLRSTSLDEIPELFNVLTGTMSLIGPRPQLVRDMVFMSEEQRMRHTARPGLSGLAQVNGRNAISWDEKLKFDLQYIENISCFSDLKIILQTIRKAFIKREGITEEDMATSEDFGDFLLRNGRIDKNYYEEKQEMARDLLKGNRIRRDEYVEGLVSIIMPSHNTAEYIGGSIDSVLQQTYDNWELLIVDDCSTDNTEAVVSKYADGRIKFFRNEKNSGAAVSRNKALREAHGEFVAFLDSDDLWKKEKLSRQVRFMKDTGVVFSYTTYEEIDESGNSNGVYVSGPKKITKSGMYNYCWPGCLTVMYNRVKVGMLQIDDIKKNNDYAMWLKVSKIADCHLLDECLASYRRNRSGSISAHSKISLIPWHYRLYRLADNRCVFVSIMFTFRNIIFGLIKKIAYVKRIDERPDDSF